MRLVYAVLLLMPFIIQLAEVGRPPVGLREWLTESSLTFLIFVLILIIEKHQTELRQLALIDPLTGIKNRRAFEQHLDRELVRANRTGKVFALAYIDVNDFKSLNDTYGHDVGDIVLINVAKRLSGLCRSKMDSCYRIGGDEFAIIFSDVNNSGQSIEASMTQRFVDVLSDPMAYNVTVSFGITRYKIAETKREIMKRADSRMFDQKTSC